MSEKLEQKAEEQPKIVNDNFKKEGYKELPYPRLHDYFIASIQEYMNYLGNFSKTFTP